MVTNLPRTSLAFLPTPLEPLPRFSMALGGPEIWIKRDDQTGLATGGNKARKLEYLIGAALADGADCVITAGSTQSNHARQTAAAVRKTGLEPHLVVCTGWKSTTIGRRQCTAGYDAGRSDSLDRRTCALYSID